MNAQELIRIEQEIVEVVDGRRGWVSLTKARAVIAGVTHDELLQIARDNGLRTETHGKHGWTAFK